MQHHFQAAGLEAVTATATLLVERDHPWASDRSLDMCAQTFMMAVYENATDLPDPSPGPTDDGYIAVAVKSVPQDPFCCAGPTTLDDGAHRHLSCCAGGLMPDACDAVSPPGKVLLPAFCQIMPLEPEPYSRS
jgi:hypothetical protein